jgi:hypothetical protein
MTRGKAPVFLDHPIAKRRLLTVPEVVERRSLTLRA